MATGEASRKARWIEGYVRVRARPGSAGYAAGVRAHREADIRALMGRAGALGNSGGPADPLDPQSQSERWRDALAEGAQDRSGGGNPVRHGARAAATRLKISKTVLYAALQSTVRLIPDME